MRTTVGTRLRLTIDGPELMCAHCGEWWPIDTASWRVNSLDPARQVSEWGKCRSCYREGDALAKALRLRDDPAYRERERRRSADYKRRNRYWLVRHFPHLVAAHDREIAAGKRAKVREAHERRTAAA